MDIIDTKKANNSNLDYNDELYKRGIEKKNGIGLLNWLTKWIAQQNLLAAVAFFLVFSVILTVISSCGPFNILNTCRGTYTESRIPFVYKDDGTTVDLNDKTTHQKVTQEKIDGSYFDPDIFRAWLILSAFILAFARWQVSNRQSAMSEIFERKRASNLQIIANKEQVKDLISGALKFDDTTQDTKRLFSKKEQEVLINHFKVYRPPGNREIDFVQRMFVYMELDNLEFAHMKYMSGYLDAEQMYRACEIFESRCKSDLFRHIATEQGLKYYTTEFHALLNILLVFGFSYSKENTFKTNDEITKDNQVKLTYVTYIQLKVFIQQQSV